MFINFPGKRCWLLNTLKNVKVLEKHVGKEVHNYMKERDSRTDDQVTNTHYVESERFLEKQWVPEGTRKVSHSPQHVHDSFNSLPLPTCLQYYLCIWDILFIYL